ncbi:MAG: endolytic transglycosylase MltG [Caulobacteraceae bacterium]|nr:endolytic transglycosylase MltG [Caulobacteraceae bacterium]
MAAAQPPSQKPAHTIAFLAGLSATLTILLLFALGVAGLTLYGPGPAPNGARDTVVVLRPGSGVSEIALTLKQAGVIRSTKAFRIAAQVTGADRSLRAGEYQFPARASLSAILGKMKNGEVVRHFVTIPEGRTSAMAVRILMAQRDLTGTVTVPPEGSILPETYEFTRGETRAAVLQRMIDARDKVLKELWATREQGLPFDTPEEAINLAAIVEKETRLAAERPRVAAVYINRLRAGVPLAADPTIIYGISRGEPLGRGIRQSELDSDSPWNSYRHAGLPPGPIANPGKASIAAVLRPAHTRELYFVANGTGGHSFAVTAAEHERNVLHWREVEAAQKARQRPDA